MKPKKRFDISDIVFKYIETGIVDQPNGNAPSNAQPAKPKEEKELKKKELWEKIYNNKFVKVVVFGGFMYLFIKGSSFLLIEIARLAKESKKLGAVLKE